MKFNLSKSAPLLLVYAILCSLPYCNGDKEDSYYATPSRSDFDIDQVDDTLYVAVYPSVVLRQGPETDTPVDATVRFGERVYLNRDRYSYHISEEILGLRGRWLPVTFDGESGWIFSPLLRESGSDDCYISEGGQLTKKSCSDMMEQKLQCLRFDSDKFPEDFSGACTHFSFFHMEAPENTADCGTAYTGVLAPDGTIKRHFQVHNGYNGSWTKEEDSLVLTIEFWQESCYEGCLFGNSPDECKERCKEESPEKWKEQRIFRITQPQVGLPEVQYGETTKRICFTQYWVWEP